MIMDIFFFTEIKGAISVQVPKEKFIKLTNKN